MRQTTRRRQYGKSAAVGALRTALNDLRAAIEEAGKPQETPLHKAVLGAAAALKRAADDFDIYDLKHKRLQKELKTELARLERILQQLQGIPVTPEEKLIRKAQNKRR